MSKLIIVCGLPGSGKTTLAKELAQRLNMAVFHKDEMKEILYDHFAGNDLEDSKKYGLAALVLLFHLAEQHVRSGIDIILEAPFYFEKDWERFCSWQEQYGVEVKTIMCDIDWKERAKRIQHRPRHRAHHDVDRSLCSQDHPSCRFDYARVAPDALKIVTDRPVEELAGEIIEKIG
ncbi:ATP-binding protein [Patescibacteria group bacterium]|nr:ATP-binding protein [Patescibacteria group bacterium]